jgi:hypothetical protein
MTKNLKNTMSLLNPDEHWLGWLGRDPRAAVHDELESIFQQHVPFDAIVAESKDIRHQVCGVFSWVAVNLDGEKERRDRTWLDLGDDAQHAAELLKGRMYFDGVDGL